MAIRGANRAAAAVNASLPEAAVNMWLFPYLSYVAIAAMAAVLIAMAFTEHLQRISTSAASRWGGPSSPISSCTVAPAAGGVRRCVNTVKEIAFTAGYKGPR